MPETVANAPGIATAIIDAAPDAMLLVAESGVIELVNQQAELLFGYGRAELVGRRVEDLLPEPLRQRHRAHRTRFRVDPQPRPMGQGLELMAQHRDGTHIPVEISLSPFGGPESMSVIAAVRDVRARRAQEIEREVVRHVIDATRDGVFVFEPESLAFTYVNQGAVEQTGYTRAELMSDMTPLHITPLFTVTEFRELMAPLLADEVPSVAFTTIQRGKDGADTSVEVILQYPQPARSDEKRLLVALVRDVTDRVRAEAQVRAKANQFGAAFYASPVPMALISLHSDDLVLVEENRANRDLTRVLGESLVGSSLAMLVHPDERNDFVRYVRAAADRRTDTEPKPFRIQTGEDANIWLEVSATPTEHGDQCLLQMMDVSAIRSLRDERSRLTVLEDRERIGRDLHDMVIQRIFATGMHLQAVASLAQPTEVAERIVAAIDDLDETIREIRTAIFSLSEPLAGDKLDQRIQRLITEKAEQLGYAPGLRIRGSLDNISGKVAAELLATLGEALSNVARHAQATGVDVSLDVSEELVALDVRDNGIGLADELERGNGIDNMISRAARLGGSCTVGPAAVGTRVEWTVPA